MFQQLPVFWEHDSPTEHEVRFARKLLRASLSLGALVLVGRLVGRLLSPFAAQ